MVGIIKILFVESKAFLGTTIENAREDRSACLDKLQVPHTTTLFMTEHLKDIGKTTFSNHDVRSQREHKKRRSFGNETFITTMTYKCLFSVLLQKRDARTGN